MRKWCLIRRGCEKPATCPVILMERGESFLRLASKPRLATAGAVPRGGVFGDAPRVSGSVDVKDPHQASLGRIGRDAENAVSPIG